MSRLGETTDTDLRVWQARTLQALTKMIQLGDDHRLPPLTWRLPRGAGVLTGRLGPLDGDHRATFDAWFTAVDEQPNITSRPLGLRGDGSPHDEQTRNGTTRLISAWTVRLTDREYPQVDVAIVVEWHEDQVAL